MHWFEGFTGMTGSRQLAFRTRERRIEAISQTMVRGSNRLLDRLSMGSFSWSVVLKLTRGHNSGAETAKQGCRSGVSISQAGGS